MRMGPVMTPGVHFPLIAKPSSITTTQKILSFKSPIAVVRVLGEGQCSSLVYEVGGLCLLADFVAPNFGSPYKYEYF